MGKPVIATGPGQGWNAVLSTFDDVVALQPELRAERLRVIGSADPELRREVETLLAADAQADARLARVEAIFGLRSDDSRQRPAGDPLGLVGRTVSHFRINEPLAYGGMGVVYRAEDTQLRRAIALKFPLPGQPFDRRVKERFLYEARVTGALDHPNLCVTYEAGETDDGLVFYAMPLYDGETLNARLAREGALPVADALRIAQQIARGLNAAHRAGIIHRDLKTANVMLLPDGTVKILDFGLARASGLGLTASRTILGTVSYMAPEQVLGEELDARTDLWALGVLLYEMMTGRRPFEGAHHITVAHSIVYTEPVPPSQLRGDIPASAEIVVSTLLSKDPANRYATADEVATQLDAVQMTDSGSPAVPGNEGEPAPTGADPLAAMAEGTSRVSRTAVLHRPMWLALAGMLVLGGALAARAAIRGVAIADSLDGTGARPAWAADAGTRTAEQGSIAVLPFVDLSPEQDQEYFSDGITEELITHLSRVEGLKVPARTSSFQFKDARTDVREAGGRLGVVHVLEGSVRKAGDRLRITVQLINVENGFHVWAETYERRMSDVFAMQEEISLAVVDALRLHLVGGAAGADSQRPTPHVGAYELFLRGRFFANQRTENSLARAAEYFQQAIALDPRYARAYVGLADAYIGPRNSAPSERFLRARELVTTALALDSTLAEAHTSMGWILMWYDRDWAAAERHLQRATTLDPGYLWAQQWYGAYLAAVGRNEESLAAGRRAQQLDPLSVAANTHVGTHLLYLGRYEEAIQQYRKALELDPDFFMARWGLGRAFLHLNQPAEAIRELQYPGTDYLGFFQPALLGHAHAVAGQEAEARRILSELRERRDRGEYVAPTEFAAIHLGLGEREAALDWLERHEADRGARIFLKIDPIFAPLRTEPRFQLLLRRLGLDHNELRQGTQRGP
jgi:eukaryotic-like serine/threonine-protein kinase